MFLIYEILDGRGFRTHLNQVNDCPTKGILSLFLFFFKRDSYPKNIFKQGYIYIRTIIATVFVRDFFHELGDSWLLWYCKHTVTVKKKIRWFHHWVVLLVQQILSAYLVPGSLVLGSQRPNKHIPDPMKFVTDMIGRRISFIHAVNMFWHLLYASFFVPRTIAVKEIDKIPCFTVCVTCQRRNLYC